MKKYLRVVLALILIVLMGTLGGCNDKKSPIKEKEDERILTNESVYKNGVDYDKSLWQKPEFYDCSERDISELNIKALFLRSDYNGKESYAFSYLGVPANVKKEKLPAVLLIHGGGGSAYFEWVKAWVEKGYVALAIDMEGNIPKPTGRLTSYPSDLYEKSEFDAPHNQNYQDSNLEIDKTWMYYATKTAIIGNSFLHNLDYVDKYKIGVCGVSWGGVITSIITGYDDRFAFSIPIYCSLNLFGSDGNLAEYYEQYEKARIWDDSTPISKVKTPINFVVSNNDLNARVDTISKTYTECQNARISILKDWQHSQALAVEAVEPYAFADNIIKGKKQIEIVIEPELNKNEMKISIPKDKSVENIYLVYTLDELTTSSSWSKIKLKAQGETITYENIDGVKAFYITIEDNTFVNISTKVVKK